MLVRTKKPKLISARGEFYFVYPYAYIFIKRSREIVRKSEIGATNITQKGLITQKIGVPTIEAITSNLAGRN